MREREKETQRQREIKNYICWLRVTVCDELVYKKFGECSVSERERDVRKEKERDGRKEKDFVCVSVMTRIGPVFVKHKNRDLETPNHSIEPDRRGVNKGGGSEVQTHSQCLLFLRGRVRTDKIIPPLPENSCARP